MYNVLICDDEKDIVNALKIYLSSPDLNFFEAENGVEALEILGSKEIHLVILDIMMPKMNGIETLSKLRQFSNVPVIMLSAKSEDTDKILGLNVGADDYITKPFNPIEVNARVRSALRRYFEFGGKTKSENMYSVGSVTLDDSAKTVTADNEEVTLTPKEFEILKMLMQSPGRVFSPKEIYEKIWEESMMPGCEKTVAVHIRHIREKIEINPNEPRFLKVIWGQGYKIEGQ